MAGSSTSSSAQSGAKPIAAFQIASIRHGAKSGISAAPNARTVLPARQMAVATYAEPTSKAQAATLPILESDAQPAPRLVASSGAPPSASRFLKKLDRFAES